MDNEEELYVMGVFASATSDFRAALAKLWRSDANESGEARKYSFSRSRTVEITCSSELVLYIVVIAPVATAILARFFRKS